MTAKSVEQEWGRAAEDEGGRDGALAAALLAAAFGILALGVVTSAAAAAEGFRDWLRWNEDVGPLSGKSSLGLAAWVGAWPLLHMLLYRRDQLLPVAIGVSGLLFLLGMLGIFPPIFERLEPG